jgi:hypothetical protein
MKDNENETIIIYISLLSRKISCNIILTQSIHCKLTIELLRDNAWLPKSNFCSCKINSYPFKQDQPQCESQRDSHLICNWVLKQLQTIIQPKYGSIKNTRAWCVAKEPMLKRSCLITYIYCQNRPNWIQGIHYYYLRAT